MSRHLANVRLVPRYNIELMFSDKMEPSLISNKDGFVQYLVPLKKEIEANSLTKKAREIHKKYGRIPYGASIYVWEVQGKKKDSEIIYIGQTIRQNVQKRFERHSQLVRLLSRYVNKPSYKVYFKLCTRMDIIYHNGRSERKVAIEHFSVKQAKRIIDDVEAFLINKYKPEFNKNYVKRKKNYWKPFGIISLCGI